MFSKRDRQGDEIDLVPTPSAGREGFARLGDVERGTSSPGWAHELRPSSPRWGHEVAVKGGKEKKVTVFPGFGIRPQEDEISLEEMVPQGGIKVKSEVVVTSSEWEWKDRLF